MRKVIWAVMALGLALTWGGRAVAAKLKCGNGKVDVQVGEICDGTNLLGQSCQSLGYSGGTLACGATCQFDTSGCEGGGGGSGAALPATGQTTAYTAEKADDGIDGPVTVLDDGTVQVGATLSYTDNGDGTITDNNTGLMWEKKSFDESLHDWRFAFEWSGDDAPFGTIWDWLDDINAEGGTGFAGYNDWRIPNVRELLSLVDYGRSARAIDPVFHTACEPGCTVTTCSCTAHSFYWSSTSFAADPTVDAWIVEYSLGISHSVKSFFETDKTGTCELSPCSGDRLFVRAVRGGAN